jgi:hypothetical protein
MRLVALVAMCGIAAFVDDRPSTAAVPAPTVIAVIGHGAKQALVRVDARTLEPLRDSHPIQLRGRPSFALSPNSSRAAISRSGVLDIVDTKSGRVLRRFANEGFDDSEGLYWVGSSARPLIIAVGDSKFGWEYTPIPSTYATTDTDLGPEVGVHDFLVLSGEGGLDFFGRAETFVELEAAPAGLFRVVADVARDRVFVVFAAGSVAEVRATIRYHPVQLNGRDFEAIWAGHHQIALWGADGLGVIDTRTWKPHALAPDATGAVPTRYGIVTWDANATEGVSVYASNRTRRLHLLPKEHIEAVSALGRYAYARNADGKQYAIDLKTGRVRKVRADAELAVPTLVSIP